MAYYQLDKTFVALDNCVCIGDRISNSRYLLRISFKSNADEKNEAFVIMLNPSSSAKANVFYGIPFSNLEDIDKTTNNVLKLFSKSSGVKIEGGKGTGTIFKIVYLLNLFPYFSPNPKDLNVIAESCTFEYLNNIKFIEHLLEMHKHAYVFVGWGNCGIGGLKRTIHKRAIKDVKTILKRAENPCFNFDISKNMFVKFNPSDKIFYVPHSSRWK